MKTLNERLAWLAGIIDGEGHIGIAIKPFRSKLKLASGERSFKQYHAFVVWVSVGNTDILMIQEIEEIAKRIGIKTYRPVKGSMGTVKYPRKKLFWVVTVYGSKQTKALLTAVLPYLVNKKERAERVLALIEYRKSKWNPAKAENSIRLADDVWLRSQLDELRIRDVKEIQHES